MLRRLRARASLLLCLLSFGLLLPAAAQSAKRIQPAPQAPKGDLLVFAAADMQPVLDVLGPYFERRTGIKLKLVYGASGKLSEQIVNGAPADIFFSADYTFAERVVAANRADNVNPYPYANGLLVLWARKDSPFQPLSVDRLSDKNLQSVAIANPATAPYGRAGLAAMNKLGLLANVRPHLVQAESVAQAAQFALTGNAQMALMSQTIAMSPQFRNIGSFVLFPLSTYLDINQCAVIMKGAAHRAEAHTLLSYITSDAVQSHFPDLGLQRIR